MSQLADQNVLVRTWGTTSHPSEGNYISLIGGDNFGHTSDGYCCWGITAPNIIDRIESAGLTWKAFAEDASGSGTCSFNPPRGADHFAFLTFADMNTPTRCANFLNTASSSDPEFIAAMNTPNPANYIWLTPNDCNNMHDCSIATGDSYLATLVPKILSSTEFTTTKAALLIVYDEGYTQCSNTGGTGECVYASFIGPTAKKGIQLSPTGASHYSYLSTIEAAWALTSLTSNDAGAPNLLSAFGAVCVTNCPLATSFTFLPSSPVVNSPVTFTAVTTGGTLPYTVSWNFGDGGTGTGAIVTHTYTSAQSFTITETAKDSSLPQQSATNSQTVTVVSSLTGNFGVCNSLPQGWNCGNLHSGAPSPSSAQIVTGVFQSRQSNPGLGGSNDYYYSTTQKGTFPWSPCSAPASGVLPSGVTSVSANFTSLSYNPGSSPSSDRYHIYIALYYWLPNGAVSAGGSTYRCLDTQVRVENIGGTFSPIGSTATYNPGDSFGWDNVTLQVSPGQSGLLIANVANQCLQDLKAWGLPTNIPCQLAGIEIGTEGYQFQELDVNWFFVSLNTSPPPPLTTDFSFTPSSPITGQSVSFTGTASGGTAPYRYSWNFGDGTAGTGVSTVHTFASAQAFTVTETVTDSSSPSQTATRSKIVTVVPTPLSTSFTFIPASPLINSPVSFTSITTGGTMPYTTTWNFGDGTTGTGATTTHTYTTAQSFTATETATDSSMPTQTATSSQTVNVLATPPLSTTFQVSSSSPQIGQTVTFTASATGGTTPYTYIVAFGDGGTGTGNPVTYAYSVAGSYTATVTVTDSASPQASISRSVTVNVQALIPPTLTVLGNQTVTAGTWINFTVTAASVNIGGTITLSATGLPAGASFDPTTGLFSWKPSASQTGSYTIVFTASDSSYPSTPTSKPTGIQVNQAAPGGSNGGNGGSGGTSNGSCTLCGIFPKFSTTIGLLAIGGLLGLIVSLAALTIRARASLERTKRRLGN
jgi:PKD repeat protein